MKKKFPFVRVCAYFLSIDFYMDVSENRRRCRCCSCRLHCYTPLHFYPEFSSAFDLFSGLFSQNCIVSGGMSTYTAHTHRHTHVDYMLCVFHYKLLICLCKRAWVCCNCVSVCANKINLMNQFWLFVMHFPQTKHTHAIAHISGESKPFSKHPLKWAIEW